MCRVNRTPGTFGLAGAVLLAPVCLAAVAGAAEPVAESGGEASVGEFTDDLVILKSDLAIEGKVVGRDPRSVSVLVPYGVLSIPRAAVKRIEYNLDSRLGELAADDHAGRYEILARAVEEGNTPQTKRRLEELVGKPGVPPDIYRLLAGIYESEGELKKALAHWKKYALARPRDEEAKKRVAELAEKLGVRPKEAAKATLPGQQGPAERGPAAGRKSGVAPDIGKEPAAARQPVAGKKVAATEGDGEPGEAGTEAEATKVAEGLEVGGKWEVLGWGNPARAAVQALDGNNVVMVEVPAGGTKDKAAIQRHGTMDLSDYDKLAFRVFNGEKAGTDIAIALITSKDYFESRTVRANPDWNMDLSVDLRGKQWKSQATKWTFKAQVEGLASVRQIIFLVYSGRRKALLYFDYIHPE